MVRQEWVLRRNRALTPRQLGLAFAILSATSLFWAGMFAVRGVWLVLGFSVLETLAVGTAFLLYARHASDRERIALSEACLLIERVNGERATQIRLDPRSTRVEPPEAGRRLIALVASGTRVEVGRFLTEQDRRELARELRSALAATR